MTIDEGTGFYSITGFATGTISITEGFIQSVHVVVPGYAPFTYLDSPPDNPGLILYQTEHPLGLDGTVLIMRLSPTYYSLEFHTPRLNEMLSATGDARLLENHVLQATGTFTLTCADADGRCQVPVPGPEIGSGIGALLVTAIICGLYMARTKSVPTT